jgi:hypothetical protein
MPRRPRTTPLKSNRILFQPLVFSELSNGSVDRAAASISQNISDTENRRLFQPVQILARTMPPKARIVQVCNEGNTGIRWIVTNQEKHPRRRVLQRGHLFFIADDHEKPRVRNPLNRERISKKAPIGPRASNTRNSSDCSFLYACVGSRPTPTGKALEQMAKLHATPPSQRR